jgi:hypothetical protein
VSGAYSTGLAVRTWLFGLAALLVGCRVDQADERAAIDLVESLPSPKPLPRATARYALSARLDETAHEVAGHGTISWTNRSDRRVTELWFHLYMNAFQKGSLFLRGSGGRSGGLVGREGRIDVHRLVSPTFAGTDLWQRALAHSPGDPSDRTDIRVPLPGPIEPGEDLELDVDFVVVLPEIVERAGYHGDYHLIAQWFPKLARLEPDGTWSHFPFHAFAEFYADFDDYEVILDVPRTHRVGATGSILPSKPAGPDRARYLARAESVVDFAWTSWSGFSLESRQIGPTSVHLLMPGGQPAVRKVHWETLEGGLSELGRWLGAYPYPELTVVVPPKNAERSGGMEYPGFITTGGSELGTRTGIAATELLVIHELAHQWFQSLVATNEAAYPFLDEGLASYTEWRFMESRRQSESLASVHGLTLSRTAAGRFGAFFGRDKPVSVSLPAREFPSFQSLAREVYCRTPLILETLARTWGRKAVDSALAHYARLGRGGHPVPEDLYQALAAYLGAEHTATIRELFENPGQFNLGIDSLSTRPVGGGELESTLAIHRRGGPALPFEIDVHFAGGGMIRLSEDGEPERITLPFRHRQPIVSVVLDPEERLVLDDNSGDDRFDPRTGGRPDTKPDSALAALALALDIASLGLGP